MTSFVLICFCCCCCCWATFCCAIRCSSKRKANSTTRVLQTHTHTHLFALIRTKKSKANRHKSSNCIIQRLPAISISDSISLHNFLFFQSATHFAVLCCVVCELLNILLLFIVVINKLTCVSACMGFVASAQLWQHYNNNNNNKHDE